MRYHSLRGKVSYFGKRLGRAKKRWSGEKKTYMPNRLLPSRIDKARFAAGRALSPRMRTPSCGKGWKVIKLQHIQDEENLNMSRTISNTNASGEAAL